jgi:prepilin-type processing-associated H-X9-DG protein
LRISESTVTSPSDMIAIGDLTDVEDLFTSTIKPDSQPPFYPGAPAACHNSGANLTFCDGHLEFAKRAKWIQATDTARRRWNNDHRPHAETW